MRNTLRVRENVFNTTTDTMFDLALDLRTSLTEREEIVITMERMDKEKISETEKQSKLSEFIFDFCHEALDSEHKQCNQGNQSQIALPGIVTYGKT